MTTSSDIENLLLVVDDHVAIKVLAAWKYCWEIPETLAVIVQCSDDEAKAHIARLKHLRLISDDGSIAEHIKKYLTGLANSKLGG